MTDTKVKRGSDVSEEASDYDLILRDKERLLSFEEPTRFIFSHSALREGWDNPNVFQICTLRHSSSATAKRQEVGRGLRICVDRNGVRQDKELLGEEVRNINVLTVIANESYADFTTALQHETRESLRERASFDSSMLDGLTENGARTRMPEPRLNSNFYREEFQALWKEINHKYVYTVSYDSDELIEKAIQHLNTDELQVRTLRYIKIEGQQDADDVTEFGDTKSSSQQLTDVSTSTVKYDLIGQISKGANLTRRSVAKILQGLWPSKISLFRNNPEEFIRKVIQIIREQKASMIVDHIHYHITDGTYDSNIFTASSKAEFNKAYPASKHVTDYVVSDSLGERNFAHDLDEASEVVVYAKLPRSFQIPTPVGSYAPDWAIAMQKGSVKHIFFVAETKGSLQSMQLNAIENAKIDCCTRLFNDISTSDVRYHKVTCYQDLIDAMTSIR